MAGKGGRIGRWSGASQSGEGQFKFWEVSALAGWNGGTMPDGVVIARDERGSWTSLFFLVLREETIDEEDHC